MGETTFTNTFVDGARDLLGVALIIGDRPRHHGDHEQRLDHGHRAQLRRDGRSADLGGVAFVNLMYFLFLPLSFLIPSSSGLATVAMPIMAPLAGFADVPPQLVVTAYQSANGLVNLVTPTSAVVMGGLPSPASATERGSSSCGPC